MRAFEFGENKIHYLLQQTSRRRSIGICVMPNTQVVLRIPKRLAKGEIERVLRERAEWILRKQSYFQKIGHRFPVHQFISGEFIPYQGGQLLLEIHSEKFFKGESFIQDEKLIVSLSQGEKSIRNEVLKWYRIQAFQEIQKSICYFSPLLKVTPHKITIRNQKHLWGSCTERGHLSFNWRLVLLPLPYLDYVVAHELCHLIHLNHSGKFWDKLESVVPDSWEKRRWLKEHSPEYLTFPRFAQV